VSFLTNYLEHTKHYESPTSFWKWSAYAVIAGILRDNCYYTQGDEKLYPNIYVLLIADSAVQRKDRPVRMVERLAQKVNNTKVINGRSSIQGILDELAKGETDKKTGKILKGGSAIWIAPEMSAGIVSDPDAIKILTDIYSFREKYDSRLRTSANFSIKNICFSFMAASNEELLRDVYDIKATMGGLLGRTFLVAPNEFRPGNSLFNLKIGDSLESLISELMEIAKIEGEFDFRADAQDTYNEWYLPFRQSYEKKSDRSGISGRIHTSVLKLAMILAISEEHELVIRKDHILRAVDECNELIPNYTKFVMSGGKSSLAEVATLLLSALNDIPEHTLGRKAILQKFWNVLDQGAETLDKVITTLEQGGMIQSIMEGDGISYKMTQKCIDILFGAKK
jgi:hypothetical protein